MAPKLLIAEDDKDVAEIVAFSARMNWSDCQVLIATDGQEALRNALVSGFARATFGRRSADCPRGNGICVDRFTSKMIMQSLLESPPGNDDDTP